MAAGLTDQVTRHSSFNSNATQRLARTARDRHQRASPSRRPAKVSPH